METNMYVKQTHDHIVFMKQIMHSPTKALSVYEKNNIVEVNVITNIQPKILGDLHIKNMQQAILESPPGWLWRIELPVPSILLDCLQVAVQVWTMASPLLDVSPGTSHVTPGDTGGQQQPTVLPTLGLSGSPIWPVWPGGLAQWLGIHGPWCRLWHCWSLGWCHWCSRSWSGIPGWWWHRLVGFWSRHGRHCSSSVVHCAWTALQKAVRWLLPQVK